MYHAQLSWQTLWTLSVSLEHRRLQTSGSSGGSWADPPVWRTGRPRSPLWLGPERGAGHWGPPLNGVCGPSVWRSEGGTMLLSSLAESVKHQFEFDYIKFQYKALLWLKNHYCNRTYYFSFFYSFNFKDCDLILPITTMRFYKSRSSNFFDDAMHSKHCLNMFRS